MSLETISQLFLGAMTHELERAIVYKDGGDWVPVSSRDLYRKTVGVARALADWKIHKGERVAILSENRPEWLVADLAAMLTGVATVPIYPTLTADQVAWVLRDSGTKAVFVSTGEQLRKVREIQQQLNLERIVLMDSAVAGESAISMHQLMDRGPSERDAAFDAQATQIQPDDLASIIYTSGTTGRMKGVMLTHRNLASNVEYSLKEIPVGPGDRHVSFLPLSHVTARHVDLAVLYRGVMIAYCPALEKVPETLREIRPTIFVAVPRLYEKAKEKVELKATGARKVLVEWALGVGRDHMGDTLAGKTPRSLRWKIADRLLFSKIRAGMGGAVKIFLSGGAPLGRELARWFAAVGIRIHEGYGLTETSPVVAVNTPTAHKLGTVGRPLKNVEVRIAEDGEILVRGPSVFKAYWNQPEETRQAFSDGWFKTGDLGQIDNDGYLSVTDRKKNLLKTSGGKFIAPQPIEARLKMSPMVEEAVVIGDQRKFPAVLIVPSFAALEDWAREMGIPPFSRDELVKHPRVRARYQQIVDELNQGLAQFEKLKRILLLSQPLSAADGTLTASMKLRRHILEERYCDEIRKLYEGADATEVTVPPHNS